VLEDLPDDPGVVALSRKEARVLSRLQAEIVDGGGIKERIQLRDPPDFQAE
jgi:hypothetical protein